MWHLARLSNYMKAVLKSWNIKLQSYKGSKGQYDKGTSAEKMIT